MNTEEKFVKGLVKEAEAFLKELFNDAEDGHCMDSYEEAEIKDYFDSLVWNANLRGADVYVVADALENVCPAYNCKLI